MAHKAARERAEKAESQVSMATLDLKTTQEEARQKQQEVTSLQTKVHRNRGGGGSGWFTVCNVHTDLVCSKHYASVVAITHLT